MSRGPARWPGQCPIWPSKPLARILLLTKQRPSRAQAEPKQTPGEDHHRLREQDKETMMTMFMDEKLFDTGVLDASNAVFGSLALFDQYDPIPELDDPLEDAYDNLYLIPS